LRPQLQCPAADEGDACFSRNPGTKSGAVCAIDHAGPKKGLQLLQFQRRIVTSGQPPRGEPVSGAFGPAPKAANRVPRQKIQLLPQCKLCGMERSFPRGTETAGATAVHLFEHNSAK